jgi:hypothetical protein
MPDIVKSSSHIVVSGQPVVGHIFGHKTFHLL